MTIAIEPAVASGTRRRLRLAVGPFLVEVSEIPGKSMRAGDWRDVLLARTSYSSMWGGPNAPDDPFDGLKASPHRAWHYLAWINDGGGPRKLVVMRKVALAAGEPLPFDIACWKVRTDTGHAPLWEVLVAYARRLAPDDEHRDLSIASMGRVAAFPNGEQQRTAHERERTAIAFAAMQLLATFGDPSLLYVWTLCAELRDRVVGVHGAGGTYTTHDFRPTEDLLGLPPDSVHLDNDLARVREHKTAFPGYWVDNDEAAELVEGLLKDGRLSAVDLRSVIAEAIGHALLARRESRSLEEAATSMAPEKLARAVTRPRVFQYVMPHLASTMRWSQLSAAGFAQLLIARAGDGPFSSTVMPAEWAVSARAVLEAAEAKYGSLRPAASPDQPRPRPRRVQRAPRPRLS